ncbi:secretory carrier-associated membrane protein [Chloropicon primus]|uniref:Secretory carrier-associated membrane protein n=1 Tax=Chloropicon primus TaxID=1764295 RepID=A0A5B8MUE0_9CHLO|nr:secretory carrier-associated membrane protein [Chloropicon primus]UPR02487.1 secretory carrier-associated membrane protein [Chloropicon primus]|mmetsp:Transcript_7791/g.22267  ORF Transcript_7791/g.22267 Transcript_7791/m.22267 type:complete len:356 (+) Transcript_7791:36-1103(+)|eukprot:QDZ23275.1 secretory carrier-associated membrane protein [Chloropicon primus]
MANLGWGGVGNTLVAGGSDEESTSATPPQAAPPQAKGGEPPVPAWATPNAGSTSKGKGKKDSGREMSKDDGPPVIPAVVESPSASGIEPVQSKKQMNARMDDISRREYAVKQREEYVKELESRLKEGGIEIKPKNWPRCKPILYHDIGAEIPVPNQPVCKAGYYCWMLTVSGYIVNFLAVAIQFFMGLGTLACFFFAALATVIGVFCSWWTVYSSLYACLQTRGSTYSYGKYFFHKTIAIGWAIWVIISPPIGSSDCFVAGFFVMIDQFSAKGAKGTTGGILSIINIVIWGLALFLSLYEMIWVFAIWKKGGGLEDLQTQQQNASTAAMVFQNDTVSSTAKRLFGGAPRDSGIKL